MKKSFIILISFFFSFLLISAQENKSDLEVKYYIKIQSDSLDNKSFIQDEMVLICNNNISTYFNPDLVNYYKHLDNQIKSASNVQEIANNYRSIPKIRHNVWKENNQIIVTMPLGKYRASLKTHFLTAKKSIG